MVTPGVSRGISAQVIPKSDLFAHQMLWIVQTEGQPNHGGDGRERDVAL